MSVCEQFPRETCNHHAKGVVPYRARDRSENLGVNSEHNVLLENVPDKEEDGREQKSGSWALTLRSVTQVALLRAHANQTKSVRKP